MERECLTILLRGAQPVIICPARSINNMRINKEYKKPLKDGRLLFLSPFDENQRRISAKSSYYRNLFVAALSAVIFVTHAGSGSKTEAFCEEILLQVIITKLTPDNSDLGLIAPRAIFEKRKDFDYPL